ncbi:FMN-binding negative transcriptional regulator [Spelaeicoccus albus]|nr:FMN-binding negative transcriptional regulator [Spelaeicoccus albus]
MWVNALYVPEDPVSCSREIIRRHPLATLIATDPLRIAHMPMLWREDAQGAAQLVGHIPHVDPIAKALTSNGIATAVFPGPQTYVSPNWYKSVGLPTYNYTPVHISGHVTQLSESDLRTHLLELTYEHEQMYSASGCPAWAFNDQAKTRMELLLPRIAGFTIAVENLDVKMKLGQNRDVDDNRSVAAVLASQAGEQSEIAVLMNEMTTIASPADNKR